MKDLEIGTQKQLIKLHAGNLLSRKDWNIHAELIDIVFEQDGFDPEYHFLGSPFEGEEIEGGRKIKNIIFEEWDKSEEFPFPFLMEDMKMVLSDLIENNEWNALYDVFRHSSKFLADIFYEQMTNEERKNIVTML